MKKLIVVDQNKRISWEDYFNHDFFKINNNNFQTIRIIFVDAGNNRTLIEINKSCKVSELEDIINEKKKSNYKDLIFHYNGEILYDDRTIADYEIEDLDVVIYIRCFRAG